MTHLPDTVADMGFYLYLIMDIYSRKIIAWEVHGTDDVDHAVRVVQRAAFWPKGLPLTSSVQFCTETTALR